jgi:prevent-host-death family protein
MVVVTARELKNRTGEVLRRVRAGETVIITVRGARVARFIPMRRHAGPPSLLEARRAQRTLVKSIAGKYRGVGTVEAFLAEKAAEVEREG